MFIILIFIIYTSAYFKKLNTTSINLQDIQILKKIKECITYVRKTKLYFSIIPCFSILY